MASLYWDEVKAVATVIAPLGVFWTIYLAGMSSRLKSVEKALFGSEQEVLIVGRAIHKDAMKGHEERMEQIEETIEKSVNQRNRELDIIRNEVGAKASRELVVKIEETLAEGIRELKAGQKAIVYVFSQLKVSEAIIAKISFDIENLRKEVREER